MKILQSHFGQRIKVSIFLCDSEKKSFFTSQNTDIIDCMANIWDKFKVYIHTFTQLLWLVSHTTIRRAKAKAVTLRVREHTWFSFSRCVRTCRERWEFSFEKWARIVADVADFTLRLRCVPFVTSSQKCILSLGSDYNPGLSKEWFSLPTSKKNSSGFYKWEHSVFVSLSSLSTSRQCNAIFNFCILNI